ncbi:MAG: inositol monophosphatase family protein [Acidobacteriota bacterium]
MRIDEKKLELELAERAVRRAADLLSNTFSDDARIRSSSGRDIKTEADLEAEACIIRELAPGGLPIVAEENSVASVRPPGPYWLVDPLDGTMNFSRGFPIHGVSVALWNADGPELGVIFDLGRGQIYRGVVGVGAWCGEQQIRVSGVSEPGQAVLATGFPTQRDYSEDALGTFVRRVQAFKKIRMIGSAALSLALVARGVFDAYVEEEIMLWDVAAGLALVQAAGGYIDVRAGRTLWSVTAAATNGWISA